MIKNLNNEFLAGKSEEFCVCVRERVGELACERERKSLSVCVRESERVCGRILRGVRDEDLTNRFFDQEVVS